MTTTKDDIDTRASGARRLPPWLWSVVAVVVLAAIFFATRPGNHTEAEDAWRYAAGVRDGGEVNLGAGSHPYSPMLLRPVFLGLRAVGLGISSEHLMALVSALASAVTVVLLVVLLKRGTASRLGVAIAGAAGLVCSYVFWRYSGEMETYALAAAVGTGAVTYAYLGRPRAAWLAWCTLFATAATVTHLLNAPVLFGAVPLVIWWRAPRDKRVKWVIVQMGVGLVLSGGLWSLRPLVAPNAGHEFLDTGQAAAAEVVRPPPARAELAPQNLPQVPVGIGQALVSPNFLFAHPWFRGFVQDSFPERQLDEEDYFGEQVGWFGTWFPFVTLAAFLALAVWVIVRARRGFRSRATDPCILPIVVWFLLYVGMMAVSEPANAELWIVSLPALWAFVAYVWFAPLWADKRWLPIAAVAALGLHNFFGGALPVMAASSDWWQARTAWLMEQAQEGDVIVLGSDNIVGGYLEYHSDARVVLLSKLPQSDFDDAVKLIQTTPGRVWTLPGTADPVRRGWMSDTEYQRLEQFADTTGRGFVKVHDDEWGGVYRYCPSGAC